MTLVTLPYRPQPGEIEDISQLMADFDAVLTVLNGGIQADNLAPDANIPPSKVPGSMPTGSLAMWLTLVAPPNWLLCDGATKNRVDFTALADVLGVPAGDATFVMPNLKGCVPTGLDTAQTEFAALKQKGGSKNISIAQLPSHNHNGGNHNHGGGTQNAGAHFHALAAPPLINAQVPGWSTTRKGAINPPLANEQDVFELVRTSDIGDHSHAINAEAVVAPEGGGQPSLSPYFVVNFIIKT
jgi:microcystin-dependent protein